VVKQLKAVREIGRTSQRSPVDAKWIYRDILNSPYIKADEVGKSVGIVQCYALEKLFWDTMDFIDEILSSDLVSKMTDAERTEYSKKKKN